MSLSFFRNSLGILEGRVSSVHRGKRVLFQSHIRPFAANITLKIMCYSQNGNTFFRIFFYIIKKIYNRGVIYVIEAY